MRPLPTTSPSEDQVPLPAFLFQHPPFLALIHTSTTCSGLFGCLSFPHCMFHKTKYGVCLLQNCTCWAWQVLFMYTEQCSLCNVAKSGETKVRAIHSTLVTLGRRSQQQEGCQMAMANSAKPQTQRHTGSSGPDAQVISHICQESFQPLPGGSM